MLRKLVLSSMIHADLCMSHFVANELTREIFVTYQQTPLGKMSTTKSRQQANAICAIWRKNPKLTASNATSFFWVLFIDPKCIFKYFSWFCAKIELFIFPVTNLPLKFVDKTLVKTETVFPGREAPRKWFKIRKSALLSIFDAWGRKGKTGLKISDKRRNSLSRQSKSWPGPQENRFRSQTQQ